MVDYIYEKKRIPMTQELNNRMCRLRKGQAGVSKQALWGLHVQEILLRPPQLRASHVFFSVETTSWSIGHHLLGGLCLRFLSHTQKTHAMRGQEAWLLASLTRA